MSYRIIIIFIHKKILLRLPSILTSAMFRQSHILNPLSHLIRVHSFNSLYLLGTYSSNRHRPHELLWNLVSWKPTMKEGGLLAKVVPEHEHRNYLDPLASILVGVTQFKNQEIQLGPSLCYMNFTLQSQENISDPTFPMWDMTLLTLVHSVLSQSH